MNTNTNTSAIRNFRGENYFLSNMFSCPVIVGGLTFRSAEAAFQAQKTMDLGKRAYFTGFDGPQAKKWGKKVDLRPDWETAKLGIMADVVLAKFQQNPELAEKLIATGDAELIEGNTWGDTYWGVDSKQGGCNELGKILMSVRDVLGGFSHKVEEKAPQHIWDVGDVSKADPKKMAEQKAVAAETVVNNDRLNAPATKTAVRLDAEREDSRFDGRHADSIFSKTEAEAYEDCGSPLDDSPVVELGYHKAKIEGFEVVRSIGYTDKDGNKCVKQGYVKLTLAVENGETFETRLYRKGPAGIDSFKIQVNKAFHGLFNYTPESKGFESMVGERIDVWVKYNDMLNQLQAEYYDVEAYKQYKAQRAQAGYVRAGYNTRSTENRATR